MPIVAYERDVRHWANADDVALGDTARRLFFLGDLTVRRSKRATGIKILTSNASPIRIMSYSSRLIQRYRRTAEQIRRNKADVYLLWLVETGCLSSTQGAQTNITSGGSLTVTSSDVPFVQELAPFGEEPFTATIALLPGPIFRSRVLARSGFFGKPVTSRIGEGRAIRLLTDLLFEESDNLSASSRTGLLNQLLAALNEISHDPQLGLKAPRSISQQRLSTVKSEIDSDLANPKLCPELIAERCNISKGYLHRLLRPSGSTFSEYVLERRLATAHQWLSEDGLRDRTISEIATMAGFANGSSFSRAFRSAFGISPRQLRMSKDGEKRRLFPQATSESRQSH